LSRGLTAWAIKGLIYWKGGWRRTVAMVLIKAGATKEQVFDAVKKVSEEAKDCMHCIFYSPDSHPMCIMVFLHVR
jgi:hypothetical protein